MIDGAADEMTQEFECESRALGFRSAGTLLLGAIFMP